MQLKFFLKKDKSWQGEKVGKELIETAVRLMPRTHHPEDWMEDDWEFGSKFPRGQRKSERWL